MSDDRGVEDVIAAAGNGRARGRHQDEPGAKQPAVSARSDSSMGSNAASMTCITRPDGAGDGRWL